MAEFVYNNTENTNTGYTSLEFNYGYHLYVFFEDKMNLYLKFHLSNKLAKKLKE